MTLMSNCLNVSKYGIVSYRKYGNSNSKIPINIDNAIEFIKSLSKINLKIKRNKLSATFINFNEFESNPEKFLLDIKELANKKFMEIKVNSKKDGYILSNMRLKMNCLGFFIEYDEFNENEDNITILNDYFNNESVEFKFSKSSVCITLDYAGTKVDIYILEKSKINLNKLYKLCSEFYDFKYLVFRLNQLESMGFISIKVSE